MCIPALRGHLLNFFEICTWLPLVQNKNNFLFGFTLKYDPMVLEILFLFKSMDFTIRKKISVQNFGCWKTESILCLWITQNVKSFYTYIQQNYHSLSVPGSTLRKIRSSISTAACNDLGTLHIFPVLIFLNRTATFIVEINKKFISSNKQLKIVFGLLSAFAILLHLRFKL